MFFLCFFWLVVLPFVVVAQYEEPASPLVPPLEQSSNFAEYRGNHFHSGLDLRVANKDDWSVFSIWEGYVSRVRFNAGAYGRAVYITHPNGYTSVYGHLAEFSPKIDSVVTKWQYENEKFSTDILFTPGQLLFEKGEKIGVVGNSGYSFGAHLHFEIRKTVSERMVNPALFFDLRDDLAPIFSQLYVYSTINNCEYPTSVLSYNVKRFKNSYHIAETIFVPDSSFLGFDLQDYQSNKYFKLLPYEVEIILDKETILDIRFDDYDIFDTKACVNIFDHNEGIDHKKQILTTRVVAGNRTNFYKINKTDGYICLNDTAIHTITVNAYDLERNKSTLVFKIKKNKKNIDDRECHTVLNSQYFHEFVTQNVTVRLDTSSFCGKICLDEAFLEESVWDGKPLFRIGNKYLPLTNQYDIILNNIDSLAKNDIFAELQRGKIVNAWIPTKNEDGRYHVKIGKCGIFSLVTDSIAPSIEKINFVEGVKKYKKELMFTVVDNSTEIPTFNAYINGKWTLMIYDLKSNLFSIPLKYKSFLEMKNLKVEFIDLAGNKTERTYIF